MSRRHEVIWRCDRCGLEATVKAKTDTHLPDGWRQIENHQGMPVDLCADCLESFGAVVNRFMSEIQLGGMDPEVDDD